LHFVVWIDPPTVDDAVVLQQALEDPKDVIVPRYLPDTPTYKPLASNIARCSSCSCRRP
jgi:hypothetical protein